MDYKIQKSHPRHDKTRNPENVLVMQGGGSLGAFSCGVYKAFVEEKIDIDFVAGTSIGAINAAIIAGSKNDNAEKDLEDFWTELSESIYNIIPDIETFAYDSYRKGYFLQQIPSASMNAAFFGVPKMFVPRWNPANMMIDPFYFKPDSWTYLYDHTPLKTTLEKYIDYKKLFFDKNDINSKNKKRLIITAVNVLTGQPLVFDSASIQIESKHLLASSGYPIYGFPWIEVEKGVYGWDGSLLSNTPVREVINISPRNDKNIFIVENYPKKIDRLPSNMIEVLDRAKDIIFSDKTENAIKMSKLITRQIQLIENLYDFYEKSPEKTQVIGNKAQIEKEYNELVQSYGAEIHSVTRITRNRIEAPNLSKNANFSKKAVKELISQGKNKTLKILLNFKENNTNNDKTNIKKYS